MSVILTGVLVTLRCGQGSTSAVGAQKDRSGISGPGVVICVTRRLAIWVTVRANEVERSLGWAEGAMPGLWVFPTRDVNPALIPVGSRAQVIWLDGNRVTSIQQDASGSETPLLPKGEVTQVLVVPYGSDLHGLQVGDTIQVVVGALS